MTSGLSLTSTTVREMGSAVTVVGAVVDTCKDALIRSRFNKIYKDEAEALYRRECHNQALNELFKTNGLLVMEAEQFVRSNPYPDGRAQKLLLEMQEILNRKLVDSMSDF